MSKDERPRNYSLVIVTVTMTVTLLGVFAFGAGRSLVGVREQEERIDLLYFHQGILEWDSCECESGSSCIDRIEVAYLSDTTQESIIAVDNGEVGLTGFQVFVSSFNEPGESEARVNVTVVTGFKGGVRKINRKYAVGDGCIHYSKNNAVNLCGVSQELIHYRSTSLRTSEVDGDDVCGALVSSAQMRPPSK